MDTRRFRHFMKHVGPISCAGELCGCRFEKGHCQRWLGHLDKQGYGQFWNGDKDVSAHRIYFEHVHGILTAEECICHACDNRQCIRLEHLWKGDKRQNTLDMQDKGRRASFVGTKNGRAQLRPEDIHEMFRRRLHGESTEDLARHFQKHVSVISGILNGTIWASVSTQEELAAYKRHYQTLLSANLSLSVRGGGNAQTKITEEDVRRMRELYAQGEMTCIELGAMFGIGSGHANQIIFGKKWGHVPGALPDSMRRGPGPRKSRQ